MLATITSIALDYATQRRLLFPSLVRHSRIFLLRWNWTDVTLVGLYLTDVTFCREGNPSHRNSPGNANKKLLNFNKYHKLARIVQDMQRFQVPPNLKDVPEAQEYIHFCLEKVKDHGDLDDLYRRR